MFTDRLDAGAQLAQTLAQRGYADKPDVLVLGIPRGGVVVAAEVARALHAPLDILVTKKIGAPGNPEYAIGAVNLEGQVFWSEQIMKQLGLSQQDRERLRLTTLEALQEKERLLRVGTPPVPLRGKTVILVDDGVATGYTTRAAVAAARTAGALRIVLAVPVGPPDTIKALAREVEELVCIKEPEDFGAVGNFYVEFHQVEDREVQSLLRPSTHSDRLKNGQSVAAVSTKGTRRRAR